MKQRLIFVTAGIALVATQALAQHNHNTTRTDKVSGHRVLAPTETDEENEVIKRRECIKSGGAWAINQIGKFCLQSLSK